jgi:hypothetical protein
MNIKCGYGKNDDINAGKSAKQNSAASHEQRFSEKMTGGAMVMMVQWLGYIWSPLMITERLRGAVRRWRTGWVRVWHGQS